MTAIHRRYCSRVVLLLPLIACIATVPRAANADEDETGAMLAAAERSMSDGNFRAGVRRYLEAAQGGDHVETARQATITAYTFGFDAIAIEAAARWAELDANRWRPELYGAMATVRMGDRDKAVRRLRQVFDGDIDADAACELIDDKLARGVRYDDALAVLDAIAKRYDDTPCLLRLAASTALAADDDALAERHIDRLRRIDAFDNAARLIEMSRLIAQDDVDAALTDDTLRLDDDATVEQRIEYAFLHARAGQGETALNMIGLLASERPGDTDVLEAQALAELQAGDAVTARRLFLELLASGEKNANALFYLARFAESERRADQALRLYSQVDDGALVIPAQQRAANLLRDRDGVPAALGHLDQFVERHPRHGLDLMPVSASLYAEGEFYEQALALYDEYLEIRPRAEFAWLARADALLRSADLDDAIDAFRDTLKRFPESANALNALGYTLADRTRRFREAERLIDRALEKEPDNAAIIDSKGWVLFRRGKLAEARDYLERAWEELPDPEVAAHLGETLWRMGEEQAARDLLEEAWQRFPGDEILRETIRRLLEDGPLTRS